MFCVDWKTNIIIKSEEQSTLFLLWISHPHIYIITYTTLAKCAIYSEQMTTQAISEKNYSENIIKMYL